MDIGLADTTDQQTRDTKSLDRALAISTVSISLGNTVTPREAPSTVGDTQSDIAIYTPDQALARLTSMYAQFGAIEAATSESPGMNSAREQDRSTGELTILDLASDSHLIDCLSQTTWDEFAPSIAGLVDHKAGREALGRAYRSAERARRVVIAASKRGSGTDLFKACQNWLSQAIEAIGSAIKHMSIVSDRLMVAR